MGNRDLPAVSFFSGPNFARIVSSVTENSSSKKEYMFSETTTYKVGK